MDVMWIMLRTKVCNQRTTTRPKRARELVELEAASDGVGVMNVAERIVKN